MHELVLDQEVRDWVLIPLTLSIVLMMVLRQYITQVGAECYCATVIAYLDQGFLSLSATRPIELC